MWPKENKKSKPKFDDVIDDTLIRQQVIQTLVKRKLLLNIFNVEISTKMLQDDINRMASQTKNPNGLIQLYDALNNNPTTIAQCVSLPFLIENTISSKFYWNDKIHSNIRNLAQVELIHYLKDGNGSNLSSEIKYITFKLKNKNLQKAPQPIEKETGLIFELETDEFKDKYENLEKELNLKERQYSFVFNEVLYINEDTIKIKLFKWKKQTLEHWLLSQKPDLYIPSLQNINAKITLIKTDGSNIPFDGNTLLSNIWKPLGHPARRYLHSSVWTGTEMIVWGGYGDDSVYINTGGRYNPSTDNWISTNMQGAPPGRAFHSALWTGAEMIVWGGFNGNIYNTGSRYNPTNDQWIEMSAINAPVARNNQSSIWTGEKMIIWGGSDIPFGSNSTNSGGIYDLSTDSWMATSTKNSPLARFYHTAVWTGEEMVVWGGFNEIEADYLNTGAKYNPENNSWVTTSVINAPLARREHTAVWTGNEMIIWGGGGFNVEFTGAKYYPSTDQWLATNISGAPSIRSDNTTVWTGTEMIVWGGDYNNTFNNGAKYNPVTNLWTETNLANAPTKRTLHSAVWTGVEMIIWGGLNSDNGFYRNDGGGYTPETNSWITITSSTVDAPTARSQHSAIWTGNEMIVWGGREVPGDFNTGGRYNPITSNWSSTSTINVPSERYNHSTIWTGTEMLIWGGGEHPNYLNTGGRYNPFNNSWSNMTIVGAPSPRKSHTAIWTGDEMIVWGGFGGSATNTGYKYYPNTNNWISISTNNAPIARFSQTSVWTGDEMIIWGGSASGGLQNSGDLYDPVSNTWSPMSTENAPTARRNHTSVWTGEEILIWSGDAEGGLTSTGGKYNPTSDTWLSTSTIETPDSRRFNSTVWTGKEMIVWGGINDNGYLITGGIYDPKSDSWISTSTNGAPKARIYHSGVWTGDKMIIWGGWALEPLDTIGTYYPTNNIIFADGMEE